MYVQILNFVTLPKSPKPRQRSSFFKIPQNSQNSSKNPQFLTPSKTLLKFFLFHNQLKVPPITQSHFQSWRQTKFPTKKPPFISVWKDAKFVPLRCWSFLFGKRSVDVYFTVLCWMGRRGSGADEQSPNSLDVILRFMDFLELIFGRHWGFWERTRGDRLFVVSRFWILDGFF
jgi:hypothetical protein